MGISPTSLIPFEFVSFLTRKYPVGWHDRLSRTIVVSDKYQKEEIEKIVPSSEKTSPAVVIIGVIFLAIFVLGFLSTLAVASIGVARMKTRDARRVTDYRIMDVALEMYSLDNAKFPASLTELKDYLITMPVNPKPNDGDCPEDFEYKYTVLEVDQAYQFEFCLGEASGDFPAGLNVIDGKIKVE